MNITPANAIQSAAAWCLTHPGKEMLIHRRILPGPLCEIKAEAAFAGVEATERGEYIVIVALTEHTLASFEATYEALYHDHYAN